MVGVVTVCSGDVSELTRGQNAASRGNARRRGMEDVNMRTTSRQADHTRVKEDHQVQTKRKGSARKRKKGA